MSSNHRSCGSCTMCCKVLSIKELEKPAGEWCQQCKPGKGCSIYADRPEVCRKFRCLWLRGDLPEWFHPVRSKIVMSLSDIGDNSGTVFVSVDPSYPNRWREEPYYSAIKLLAQNMWAHGVLTVVWGQGDDKKLWITGQGAFDWDTEWDELERQFRSFTFEQYKSMNERVRVGGRS